MQSIQNEDADSPPKLVLALSYAYPSSDKLGIHDLKGRDRALCNLLRLARNTATADLVSLRAEERRSLPSGFSSSPWAGRKKGGGSGRGRGSPSGVDEDGVRGFDFFLCRAVCEGFAQLILSIVLLYCAVVLRACYSNCSCVYEFFFRVCDAFISKHYVLVPKKTSRRWRGVERVDEVRLDSGSVCVFVYVCVCCVCLMACLAASHLFWSYLLVFTRANVHFVGGRDR